MKFFSFLKSSNPPPIDITPQLTVSLDQGLDKFTYGFDLEFTPGSETETWDKRSKPKEGDEVKYTKLPLIIEVWGCGRWGRRDMPYEGHYVSFRKSASIVYDSEGNGKVIYLRHHDLTFESMICQNRSFELIHNKELFLDHEVKIGGKLKTGKWYKTNWKERYIIKKERQIIEMQRQMFEKQQLMVRLNGQIGDKKKSMAFKEAIMKAYNSRKEYKEQRKEYMDVKEYTYEKEDKDR